MSGRALAMPHRLCGTSVLSTWPPCFGWGSPTPLFAPLPPLLCGAFWLLVPRPTRVLAGRCCDIRVASGALQISAFTNVVHVGRRTSVFQPTSEKLKSTCLPFPPSQRITFKRRGCPTRPLLRLLLWRYKKVLSWFGPVFDV